jgi:Xaa-Pro aminopeptidase
VQNEPRQACLQKYFMHGTSHHMGLDTTWFGVFDWTYASQYDRTGNLYSAEGFGIRLEDDLVIQESGEPFNPCATFLLKRWKFDESNFRKLLGLKM